MKKAVLAPVAARPVSGADGEARARRARGRGRFVMKTIRSSASALQLLKGDFR
jgi:hypothetical protein